MNDKVEEAILKAVFKDKVITDILVDNLLPPHNFDEDLSPGTVYRIARSILKDNINSLLES